MDPDGTLPFVVNLPPADRFEPTTVIGKLEPNQRQINLLVIVLRIQANPQKTREGHEIHSFKVADRTGSVTLNVWNTAGQMIAPGDILRLQNCITQVFKNELCVKPGRSETIARRRGETPPLSPCSRRSGHQSGRIPAGFQRRTRYEYIHTIDGSHGQSE